MLGQQNNRHSVPGERFSIRIFDGLDIVDKYRDGSSGLERNNSEPEHKPNPIPRKEAPAKSSYRPPPRSAPVPLPNVLIILLLLINIFHFIFFPLWLWHTLERI